MEPAGIEPAPCLFATLNSSVLNLSATILLNVLTPCDI